MRRTLARLGAAVGAALLLGGCSAGELIGGLAASRAVPAPPEDYVAVDDGFRYTKQFLTPQEQALYDTILPALQAQEDAVEGLWADADAIGRAVQAIDRDHPELFWFSGTGQIETTYFGETPLSAVYRPVYTMDEAERAGTQATIDAWVTDHLGWLPADATDYEKVRAVYDEIVAFADYADVPDNSIVNVLVEGRGLCGCYAKTTQYLLERLGVDCAYISGTGHGESHAWDLVWIDGDPVWVDTTWGDPVPTGSETIPGPVYDYFCITTADLLRDHTIDDTVPVPVCTAERYDYYHANGLWFDHWDPDGIAAALARCAAAGQASAALCFADAVYPTAVDRLFDRGEIDGLLRRAGVRVDGPIWYSCNDDMGTVSIRLGA